MALAVERRLATSVVVVVVAAVVWRQLAGPQVVAGGGCGVAPAGRAAGGSRWRAGGSYGPALPCVAAAQVVVGRPAAAQVALYGVVVAVVTMAAPPVATGWVVVVEVLVVVSAGWLAGSSTGGRGLGDDSDGGSSHIGSAHVASCCVVAVQVEAVVGVAGCMLRTQVEASQSVVAHEWALAQLAAICKKQESLEESW
jgi:hypothetical protein